MFRSSRLEVFCKKGAVSNFEKFTRKHLRRCLFFNKVAGNIFNGCLCFPAPDPLLAPGPGPEFVFTGPGSQFVFTGPGPQLYLPALAPTLCLLALAPNLYLPALAVVILVKLMP